MAKSIMEIAMENMASMAENPNEALIENVKASTKTPLAPDIKEVKVDDDFSSMILESSFGIKQTKPKPKVVETKKAPKRDLDSLVTEFFQVVSKAKSLIQEMTTCGMIGTKTMGFKKKKKVKR